MGLETALMAIGGALLAPMVSSLMGGDKKEKAPTPQAPTPPPQAAQAPDQQVFRQKNTVVAGATGPTSTLLTGASGVSDNMLTLGKNTLLGQ